MARPCFRENGAVLRHREWPRPEQGARLVPDDEDSLVHLENTGEAEWAADVRSTPADTEDDISAQQPQQAKSDVCATEPLPAPQPDAPRSAPVEHARPPVRRGERYSPPHPPMAARAGQGRTLYRDHRASDRC